MSRYPGWDVMSQRQEWDEHTQAVVDQRLQPAGPLRFFTPAEAITLRALCARLLVEQSNYWLSKVVEYFDTTLATGSGEGYRPPDVPADQDLMRAGLAGVDQAAQALFDNPFYGLTADDQDAVIRAIAAGDPPGTAWQRAPARAFFKFVLRHAVGIYCALPPVWSQMGYGGPAYPRGYVRIELGGRDPWEPVSKT